MTGMNDAISNIESGGNYGLLGPLTKSGDRAYGKYQVMGNNIGPWTKEVLGVEMSPKDFLGSPQVQDAVFNQKFNQYVQKYGPDGAARAWFAGEKGMNNLNAKDSLGTSVADYQKKFDQQMAPPLGAPTNVSQLPNPVPQQPMTPIQSPQGAPQFPSQQMGTAPNSGVVGASPYSNQALTGGDGFPIGGLPSQQPMPRLSGPNPAHIQAMQQYLANMPQQIRPYIFGFNR